MQPVGGRLEGRVRPEPVDQHLAVHVATVVEGQQQQQLPRSRAERRQRHGTAVHLDPERPQAPDEHAAPGRASAPARFPAARRAAARGPPARRHEPGRAPAPPVPRRPARAARRAAYALRSPPRPPARGLREHSHRPAPGPATRPPSRARRRPGTAPKAPASRRGRPPVPGALALLRREQRRTPRARLPGLDEQHRCLDAAGDPCEPGLLLDLGGEHDLLEGADRVLGDTVDDLRHDPGQVGDELLR